MILLLVILIVFFHYIFRIYKVSKKVRYIQNLNKQRYIFLNMFITFLSKFFLFRFLFKFNFFKNTFSNIKNRVKKLNYKLLKNNVANYFGIKEYVITRYFLSFIFFLTLSLFSGNFLLSTFVYFFVFYLPDIILLSSRHMLRLIIKKEFSNFVQNIILLLSSDFSLYDSLKFSLSILQNGALKNEIDKIIYNYKAYNFNMQKAWLSVSSNFKFYEFNMFLSMLIQGQKDGKTIEYLRNLIKLLKK